MATQQQTRETIETTKGLRTSHDKDVRVLAGRLEVRAAARAEGDETAPGKIVGYAALFNVEAVIGGFPWGFREIIEPGAFTAAIAEDDVRALFNHDSDHVLGRNKAGTLVLEEDETGLRYEIDPPNTQLARDLATSIARGDISGSSFTFRVVRDEWTDPPIDSQELPLRRILEARLEDIAPVTFPAYETTSVSVSARSKVDGLREAADRRAVAVGQAPLEAEAESLRLAAARAKRL